MFENTVYDWYGGTAVVAETKIAISEKADLRIPSSAHELVSRCSAVLKTNNLKQVDCKWFKKAPSSSLTTCTYDRWGIMCDKIILNEKEIN